MDSALLQPRPKHRSRVGARRWLLAALLVLLQVATPAAHAMLHAGTALAPGVGSGHDRSPAWSAVADSTTSEDKPCALCAADHLLAMPEQGVSAAALGASPAKFASPRMCARSSAPLDLFCRPPPSLGPLPYQV